MQRSTTSARHPSFASPPASRSCRPAPDRFADLLALDDVLVLDAPLRGVVPLAGPFGAFLLLAMTWLSLS